MPHPTLRDLGREAISPTSIRLPVQLKDRLIEQSRKRRQPLSMLIVYVLEQWVAYQEKEKK